MENQDWQELVEGRRQRALAHAWQILDGTDGSASGTEHALNAALASIDAIYGIEATHAFNQDVASPADMEEHGSLPGFAAGT